MRNPWAAALLLALPLVACGSTSAPHSIALEVVNVRFPTAVSAAGPLQVEVRVALGSCEDTEHRLTPVSRTTRALALRAEATRTRPGNVCPTVYVEGTLSYTDPGKPARMDPFEVIVNGKSWGKVSVQ